MGANHLDGIVDDVSDVTDLPDATYMPASGTALHVVTRYLRGGSERRVRDVVGALDEFRHHVVVGSESDLDLAIADLPTCQITLEPSLRRNPNPLSDPLAVLRIRRIINSLRPDIVFTHQSKAGAIGRLGAWAAGRPVVVHSLSMANFGEGYSPAHSAAFRWIERRLAPLTSAYAVVGHDLAGRYRDIGVPEEKLGIIRSGVPIPKVAESAQDAKHRLAGELAMPVDQPWLVHVGSLEPRKNVMMLPDLLETLLDNPEVGTLHMVIAGVGPLEDQLKDELATRGLSSYCTMLGYVNGVAPLIKASSALVLLSSAEGLPQVLVQSASVGTPFVTFDVDGTRELLDLGASGKIVELGDLRSAVSAVAEALSAYHETSSVDFGSWAPETIRRQYRELVTDLLSQTTHRPQAK